MKSDVPFKTHIHFLYCWSTKKKTYPLSVLVIYTHQDGDVVQFYWVGIKPRDTLNSPDNFSLVYKDQVNFVIWYCITKRFGSPRKTNPPNMACFKQETLVRKTVITSPLRGISYNFRNKNQESIESKGIQRIYTWKSFEIWIQMQRKRSQHQQ